MLIISIFTINIINLFNNRKSNCDNYSDFTE